MADLSVLETLQRQKTLLSAEKIAEVLGVSKISIYKWSKRGVLPSVRIGATLRFDPIKVARALVEEAR